MGRKYYLDPVTKEKIYIRNTVSKPPVIDVQVDGESVLEDRIAKINLSDKQDTLISGVNIKTINNRSILGSGNITITGTGEGGSGAIDIIEVNGVEQANNAGVVNLTVPTKTSDLQNDSGFLTEHQDLSGYATKGEIPDVSGFVTDSQLNAYLNKEDAANTYVAKETGKSLISDSEITRLSTVTNYDDTDVRNLISNKADISSIPTKTSELTNDSGFITSVPSEYITETELESKGYLTEHQSLTGLATESYVNNKLGTKVDKVEGKGLSTNDLTNALKSNYDAAYTHSQAAHAPSNAEANVQSDWNVTDTTSDAYIKNKPSIPTKTSELTNDSNFLTSVPPEYITETELTAKDYATKKYVTDKVNEASISGGYVHPDTHPASMITGLSAVATSGDYNDLINKPVEVTESIVSNWGFTKNNGTVTSVKMNNTSKTPVNGVVDLGTIITDISGKQDVISDLDSIRANATTGAGLSTQVNTNKEDIADIKADLNSYLPLSGGTITGDIAPNLDNTISLGTDTKRFKEIYAHELKLSTNSLYLGDTKILGTDADTINIKGDAGQHLALKSQGSGVTNIQSFTGVTIETVAENGTNPDGSVIKLKALGNGSSISMVAPSIGLTGNTTVNNLTVTGNLNVSGTTTTVNSQNLEVKDNIIEINKGETGAGVSKGTAGIKIDRGEKTDFFIIYDESDTKLKAGIGEENVKSIATEEYVNNITDNKLDASATAISAEKLTTNAGNATQPVYFDNGIPVATAHTLGASVPADAKFTDTTYTASNGVTITGTNITNSGVRSISEGTANGTIKVDTNGTSKDVAIKGLGSAAFTSSDTYAAAAHNHVIADVSGLQSALDNKQATISSINKLSADLISDGTTNKVVTSTEKSTWNAKQNSISDLETIRTNASSGKSAADTIATYGDIVSHDATDFAQAVHTHEISEVNGLQTALNGKQSVLSATQLENITKGGTAVQPSDLATVATSGNYNDLSNKPTIPSAVTEATVSGWGFTKNTGTVTSIKMNGTNKNPASGVIDLGTVITAHQDISGKQDVINDLDTIRANASKGATALQSIPSEYITETELNNKGYLTSYTESDPVYTADKPNIALKSEIPTKVSELTNDSGFKTKDTTYSLSKSGSTITLTSSDGTKTTVEDSDTTYSNATTTAAGLMSAADKSKLDGLIACTDAEIDAIFA